MNELWQIYVPTIRANGKPIRTRHHRAWDEQVYRITGGMTILKPALGKWVSPDGILFKDRMIPVLIACDDSQIDEVIRRTLNHYQDELAVFAYKVSSDVRIVERNAN